MGRYLHLGAAVRGFLEKMIPGKDLEMGWSMGSLS